MVRRVEIQQPHAFLLPLPLRVVEFHRDAVTQQAIDFAVRSDERHRLPPIEQIFQRSLDGHQRDVRVQTDRGFPRPIHQNHIALVGAVRTVVQVFRIFRVTVERIKTV